LGQRQGFLPLGVERIEMRRQGFDQTVHGSGSGPVLMAITGLLRNMPRLFHLFRRTEAMSDVNCHLPAIQLLVDVRA
jgi:hypothetical protein